MDDKNEQQATQLSDSNNRADLIRSFMDNQSKELELRSEELVLKKQEDSNAYEYAKTSLDRKIEDRKNHREHQKSLRKMTLLFSGGVVFLLIALLVTALVMGKDDFAKEIVKAVIFVSGGAFGGYGYASSRKPKSDKSSD